jgi:hypothetical protein
MNFDYSLEVITPENTNTIDIGGTGAFGVPIGTTAEAPTPNSGLIRYDSTLDGLYWSDTTSWHILGKTSIVNDVSTTSNRYPIFADNTTGNTLTLYTSDAKYLYKPSTGELTAPELMASNGLVLNNTTVSVNYDIVSGTNAMSVGPITINSGVVVTVASGQRWVII